MSIYKFQKKPFLLLNLFSILLILTWTFFPYRGYWDIIDSQIFELTNKSLVYSDYWSVSWAILSVRVADLLPLIFIVAFFYFDKVLFCTGKKLQGLVNFVSLLILMLIVREGMDLYVELMKLERASPTLLFDSALRLSKMYPELPLKDSSLDSFPGDHAAVLFTWLGYSLFIIRNKFSWMVVAVVLIFIMPRVMAGAHWVSDILVGGLGIALITLAFGIYTPILNKLNKYLFKLTVFFAKL